MGIVFVLTMCVCVCMRYRDMNGDYVCSWEGGMQQSEGRMGVGLAGECGEGEDEGRGCE